MNNPHVLSTTGKRSRYIVSVLALAGIVLAQPANALLFDANVTSNVIMGTGIANGAWTLDRSNGIELGLRSKQRFPSPGPIYNSNGDGTYSWAAGSPSSNPGKAFWSWEWSINTNWDDSTNYSVGNLTYAFGIDSDPSPGISFTSYDYIALGGDHSFGNNLTAQSAGVEATNPSEYANLLSTENLVQNSWQPQWHIPAFNPAVDGTYDFFLAAFDGNGNELARTAMTVLVGNGGIAVPEPGTIFLMGAGLLGLLGVARRQRQY